jgi:hypothetical protein
MMMTPAQGAIAEDVVEKKTLVDADPDCTLQRKA